MTSLTRWWMVWSAATALCLLLMLFHRSDTAVFMGRYSSSYMVQLGVMAVALLVCGGMLTLAARGKLPDLRPSLPKGRALGVMLGLGILGLIALWWWLPGARQQPAIALFSAYLVVGGSSLLLWIARTATGTPPAWIAPLLLAVSITVSIGLAAVYMGHLPASLLYDEPRLANQGYEMFRTGTATVPMYPDADTQRPLREPILYVTMGEWLNLVGMSLVNARWFWWLMGAASVPFIFLTARRVYGTAGAVTAAVIAASLLLLHTYLRADYGVTLGLAIALFALGEGQARQRWAWYFVAGLAIAATMTGHMLSMRWIAAFGLMMTIEYARVLWQARGWRWYAPFWAFIGGGLVFTVIFLYANSWAWHISLSSYLAGLSGSYNAEAGLADVALYGQGIIRLLNIAQVWFIQYVALHPLEFGLGIVGLLYWAGAGNRQEQRWGVLFLLGTLGLFVLLPKPSAYYWVHHLPFIALAGAGLLVKISRATRDRLTWAWVVGVVLLISLSTVDILWNARTNTQNADQTIALGYQLNQLLPQNVQRVAARQPYYYGLAGRQFVNIEVFHNIPWQQWQTKLGILLPQAVLVTRGWDDPYPAVFDYLKAAGFVKVQCFPLDIYALSAELYLLPQDVPPQLQSQCKS